MPGDPRSHAAPPSRCHAARRVLSAARPPGVRLTAGRPDEYQNGACPGSLVRARRCWLDLMAADSLALPQRFSFAFGCPTERMARGLRERLRFGPYAGFVQSAAGDGGGRWEVLGTTHAAVWCLPSLEHLFMHLRAAGAQYESPIVSLDLVPAAPCLP